MKEKSPAAAVMENDQGSSFPSNYVTFLQLKERWLQQQSPKSNPHHLQSDSQLTVKSKHDSGSKLPNDAVPGGRNRNRNVNRQDSGSKIPNEAAVTGGRNRNRMVNQRKPEVAVNDSGSESPNDVVPRGGNRNRMVNQRKPEVEVHDSGSEIPNDVVPRGRNRRRAGNKVKLEVPVSDSASKTLAEDADNHPMVEKNEHHTDQSISKPSRKKNGYRGRNPGSVTDQNQTGGSTEPEPEPEPVQEKKQHRYNRRRDRNKEAREPKGKTASFAQNVDGISHSDSGGVVEAVAAAVKEIKVAGVNQGTNRRPSSGRFNGGTRNGPPIPIRKGQMTAVWVKKGESAPN